MNDGNSIIGLLCCIVRKMMFSCVIRSCFLLVCRLKGLQVACGWLWYIRPPEALLMRLLCHGFGNEFNPVAHGDVGAAAKVADAADVGRKDGDGLQVG